jgi:hypothetical protein
MASFEEAVVRAKVAKICDHVGYHAISRESASILVDLYIRTFIHLARHCKEFANNNRRVEPTLIDLIQAYDFIGISIPELKEHAENVKISLDLKVERDEAKPSNRIQRNLFVDDLLEAEKNNGQIDDKDEGSENKASNDNGDELDTNVTPLLKDIYQEISNKFPSPAKPIVADKARIKREEKPVIPKLKITPLDPSVAEPPSFLPILENSSDILAPTASTLNTRIQLPALSEKTSKGRRKNIKVPKIKGQKLKVQKLKGKKAEIQKIKGQKRGRKPNTIKQSTTTKVSTPDELIPSPTPSTPSPPRVPSPALPTPPPVQPSTSKSKTKLDLAQRHSGTNTPEVPITKPTKKEKKKKRSSNQFAIVTETVTTAAEEKEWLCPTCNGPDNGDLMVGCDTCDLWYHLRCTNLKRPPKEEEKWSCIKCTVKEEVIKQQTPTPPPALPPPPEPQPSAANIAPVAPIGSSQDDLCPECHLPDDGTLMIQCDDPFCARWFHGKCVSVLEEPKDDDSWFCKGCVEKQQSAFKRRRRAK